MKGGGLQGKQSGIRPMPSFINKVTYSFSGFLAPVSLLKPFKLGSTVPVKFQLTDATGNLVTFAAAGFPCTPTQASCHPGSRSSLVDVTRY